MTRSKSKFLELFERADRQSIPLKVMLELTYRCNFRCQHCYLPADRSAIPLATARVLEILEELKDLGTLFLGLTGGEPLLRSDWPVIAGRARELGFYVTLLSNGALIDETIADLIAELGLVVHVSFFSVEDQVFSKITGQPESALHVTRGLDLLAARQVPVTLKVPMMQVNRHDLAAVEHFGAQRGFDVQSFARLSATTDGSRAPTRLRLIDADLDAFYRSTLPVNVPADAPTAAGDPGPLCAAGSRLAVITPDGRLLPCTGFPRAAGDLHHLSFLEIWQNSDLLRELRSIRRDDLEVCRDCANYDLCGRCPAQALAEDGDLRGPSTEACAHAAAVERVTTSRRS